MNVTLEAIKFNYMRSSAKTDAFSIRRNQTRQINQPEWQRGRSWNPEDAPAAYALGEINNQILTIQARIVWDDPTVAELWIRAVDVHLYPKRSRSSFLLRAASTLLRPLLGRLLDRNVLGEVSEKRISSSADPADFQTFQLRNVMLQQAGIGVSDISWLWQFSLEGTQWTDLITTTHRIYAVRELPKGKWEPNSPNLSNTQLPWTEVLDYACQWAAGAPTLDQIPDLITAAINGLGPTFIHYDNVGLGAPHYIREVPLRFDCQRFLDLLRGEPQHPLDPNVDCDDCAAMVSSFVTVLGYALPISSMSSPSGDIPLRQHLKIGLGWEPSGGVFHHHAVVWRGEDKDGVWDACLKLDANEGVTGDPIALLARALPFASEHGYRSLLVPKGQEDKCVRSGEPIFLRIGLTTGKDEPDIPEIDLNWVNLLNNHDSWRTPDLSQVPMSLLAFVGAIHKIGDWVVTSARFVPKNWIELFLSLGESTEKQVLRVDAQFAETAEKADLNLDKLRGRFELPGLKRREDAGFGNHVFADDFGFVILFSHTNVVILIRNIMGKPFALWDIAKAIDVLLSRESEQTSAR